MHSLERCSNAGFSSFLLLLLLLLLILFLILFLIVLFILLFLLSNELWPGLA